MALLLGSTCDSSDGPTCPQDWVHDQASGTCQPTQAYTDGLGESLGSGAYGFAMQVTGNCAPGSCNGNDCATALTAGVRIVAYAAEGVDGNAQVADCLQPFDLLPGAAPSGEALTDESGRYAIPLPNGIYALTAVDPVDQCPFLAGHAEVTDDQPLGRVLFEFDHGAY